MKIGLKKTKNFFVIAGMMILTGCNGGDSSKKSVTESNSAEILYTSEADATETEYIPETTTTETTTTETTTIETTTIETTTIETTTTETEYVSETAKPEKNYIANKKSKKLHSIYCDSLPYERNRVYFSSIEEANNAGYTDNHKECMSD
ncbi:MAG: hypothetical protein K2K14_10110 [Ruminococcus sp.]|nr:hypothetical protein [Ruminococcus sp.]